MKRIRSLSFKLVEEPVLLKNRLSIARTREEDSDRFSFSFSLEHKPNFFILFFTCVREKEFSPVFGLYHNFMGIYPIFKMPENEIEG